MKKAYQFILDWFLLFPVFMLYLFLSEGPISFFKEVKLNVVHALNTFKK